MKDENANKSLQKRKYRQLLQKTVHVILTQTSAKKVIKKFEQRVVASIINQLKQIDREAMEGKPVVDLIYPSDISAEDKIKALEANNLIKEKGTKN